MRIDYQYWNNYPGVGEPDEMSGAEEGESFFIPSCYAAVYQISDENGHEIAEGDFPVTGYSFILENNQLKQFGRRGGTRVVASF